MPSKRTGEANEKFKNLTLRFPDAYHRELVLQSSRRGLTLNGLLIDIVYRHLLESGFAPDVIKSLSGRLFEIAIEPIPNELLGYFCSRFDVYENHPLYTKRRAHYVIGVDEDLVEKIDPYGVVKEVGLGLLNFYNRQGLEIDQLAWQTRESDPPSPSPTMKDNWRYIGQSSTRNISEFLIALARNHWKDELVVATGRSQDIRCNLRTERDLYR
ncbi:MAG: hypothetical protein K2X77_21080 [Candidatus Obscuribacterales bacterium]|nr:hypothetical protein [Candidatus Obscuribacterales bacterium]